MIEGVRALVVVMVFACATAAHADSWIAPLPQRLTSPNGKLEALITPAPTGTQTKPKATVGPKGKPGKTYELVTPWMPVDAVLFDDGSLLALDQWHRLGHGDVAILHERDGRVRWKKTLVELVGQKYIDSVQHSVSSIWWRRTPLEWSLAKDGKSVVVTLADENQVRIVLRDGATKQVAVAQLPDDPQRLLNRARALARRDGQEAAAFAALDRALAKDPQLLEAALLYVQVAQRTNDHARAVALLDRLASGWKQQTGYNIANVYVAWAKSLEALGRPRDAERVLRLAVLAAPEYTNPALALATLLVSRGEQVKADAVLDAYVDRLFKATHLDLYGVGYVADFYRDRKLLAKALAIYRRGWKPDQVTNQFLYENLAKLYEEMGNIPEAIRVHEQLLAHFKQMGAAFATYAKETADELARLRAKSKP